MGNPSSTRILLGTLAVISSLALGGLAGKLISLSVKERNEKQWLQHRAELRRQVLAEMKTMKIGDTLVDYEFDDLDGRTIRLSSLVREKGAIIGIISPDCGACQEEVSGLTKLIPNSSLRSRFIFVSAGDVQQLQNLRRVSELTNPFLVDRNSAWSSNYRIPNLPFNVIVDHNLVVQEILPMSLAPEDVSELE